MPLLTFRRVGLLTLGAAAGLFSLIQPRLERAGVTRTVKGFNNDNCFPVPGASSQV